jgi:hypothetical protein
MAYLGRRVLAGVALCSGGVSIEHYRAAEVSVQ